MYLFKSPLAYSFLSGGVIGLAALLSLSLMPGHVEKDPNFFDVPYRNTCFELDGQIDDWKNQSFIHYYVYDSSQHIKDSIAVAMAWDEHFFYFAAQSYDQNLVKMEEGSKNPNLWRNDGIELYFDPKLDSGKKMDINDFNCVVDLAAEYTFFTPTPERIEACDIAVPKDANQVDIYFETASSWKGTLNNNSDIDQGYTLEIRIPWTPLGILPQEGDSLRLEVCTNDLDTLAGPEAWKTWVVTPDQFYFGSWSQLMDWGQPQQWKKVRLIGHPSWVQQLGRDYPTTIIGGSFFMVILLGLWSLGLHQQYLQLKDIHEKSTIENQELLKLVEHNQNAQPTIKVAATKPQLPIFNLAQTILEERLSESIRPADLAQALNLSLRQFQRLCKEELGTTPNAFITLFKVEKAAALLRTREKNVTEVAYDVGFSDPGYFSKVFKKYFNQSPKEYVSG